MKESQRLYNPKTAVGNKELIEALKREQAEAEAEQRIKDCKRCDDQGRIDMECDQCYGRGSIEVTCEHDDDQTL